MKAVLPAFLEELFEAGRRASIDPYLYRLGPCVVDVRYGDMALQALFARALPSPEPLTGADLTLYAWCGGPLPRPPWDWSKLGPRGEVAGWNDEENLALYDVGRRMLTLLHRPSRQGVLWVNSIQDVPSWEVGAPFLAHVQSFLAGRGTDVVHGAAVSNGAQAVLLVGRGGSGKSTTALTALQGGLEWLSDDYSTVQAGLQPRVGGLYRTAKIDTARYAEFLPVGAQAGPVQGHKTLLFLPATAPGRPLKAVLVPAVTGCSESRLVPLSPAAAYRHLAPSTLLQSRSATAGSANSLATLLQQVPSYRLELGPDPQSTVRALREAMR